MNGSGASVEWRARRAGETRHGPPSMMGKEAKKEINSPNTGRPRGPRGRKRRSGAAAENCIACRKMSANTHRLAAGARETREGQGERALSVNSG